MRTLNRPLLSVLICAILGMTKLIIMTPSMDATIIGRATGWMLLVLLVAGRKALWKKPDHSFFVLLFCGLLIFPIVGTARACRRLDLFSFFFHIQFEMGIEALKGFEKYIAQGLISTKLVVLGIFFLRNLWSLRGWAIWAGVAFFVFANRMSL
jgi:hypothetical protein